LCALNTKRRALDQIERQLKNTSTNLPITGRLVNDKVEMCDLCTFVSSNNTNLAMFKECDDDYGKPRSVCNTLMSWHQ
uniref:Ground-like domain-containing protein n=1 Tax=Gongylonema pulchrum TaxID=637853 RepID=A0A183DH65_9BILA